MNTLDLVRKRHEGDGWLVFSEVGDKPGYYANRHADALALGVWASTRYEAHLYEFKISREDLKRELRDPSKAEAVGKYCTYWWLVVESEKVLADLVVPDVWGILIPTVRGGSRLLKVHRKAPKLEPKPFNPTFAMALIRNIAKGWTSPADHQRILAERDAALDKRNIAPPPDVEAKQAEIDLLTRKLKNLEEGIHRFHCESGVDLRNVDRYEHGNIGRAVKVAIELHRRMALGEIGDDIARLSATAHEFERRAHELAAAAVSLRSLLPTTDHAPQCRSKSAWGRSECSCGAVPLSEAERKLASDEATGS